MRVTFLTHYYPPEVGAPQARISALARGLVQRGTEVTVHTCFPHYPAGRVQPPFRNRPLGREQDEGVQVIRSAVYAAANRGFARRLADHLSFATTALVTAPATGPADVVVVETPPLFTAGAAIAYARAKRAALVVNVADRWPESAVQLGALSNARAIAAAEWLERAAYRAAARISVPTHGLVGELEQMPEARGKVLHMAPAVDLERFEMVAPSPDGALRLLYAGTVGMAQGVDTLVDAARIAGPSVVSLTIAGDGAEADAVAERAAGAPNVRLLGAVPAERIPALYADADAAVVLLRDRPLFEAALPTKMLEAMAAARPLLVAARGEAAHLVEQTGAGLAVAPEDPQALAQAIRRLARDEALVATLGAAGRRLAETRFGRDRQVDRWLELLSAVSPR